MIIKILGKVVSMAFFILISVAATAKNKGQYFQITVYHFSGAAQEQLLDDYLANAWLPYAHKLGVQQVGIFKPISNDTSADKTLYVIRSFKSIEQLAKVADKMWEVANYTGAGDYINSNYKTPPFTRMDNTIASAFAMAPVLTLPTLSSVKTDRIYEFRSYESATEKIHNNKVEMFNQGGEVALFTRLNFNAVFYGKVVAGSKMPNLVYMTSFENMDDRNAHWKTFVADEEWKKLSAMPIYKNNVSKSDVILMKATAYSDF